MKVASIVTRSGGLFRLGAIVDDKSGEDGRADDQEKDWK